jgi:hypothetical protein
MHNGMVICPRLVIMAIFEVIKSVENITDGRFVPYISPRETTP